MGPKGFHYWGSLKIPLMVIIVVFVYSSRSMLFEFEVVQ